MKARVEDSRKVNNSVYRRRRAENGEIYYTKEQEISFEEYRKNVLIYEKKMRIKEILK